MIRRRPRESPLIPYEMFDADRTRQEADIARKLERVYHKGQDKVWDGKQVLAELIEKHGGIQASPETLAPLSHLFAVILWGELAAWKVAASLSLELDPLEVKMATTAQAHDEARHFYVMHDYLDLIGYVPERLPATAARVLEEVVGASSMAKKILGMHLMIEPIALTLFQVVREQRFEPVLCDLLKLYERDEARHVALGVHYLPTLMKGMRRRELLDLWSWQLKMFMLQLDGLADMESDFRALGLHPREVLRLGQAKQLQASEIMLEELGMKSLAREVFVRVIEARLEWQFPQDDAPTDLSSRMQRVLRAAVYGPGEMPDGGLAGVSA